MKFNIYLVVLIAVTFALACSNPQNSNKEMSDTTAIYNQKKDAHVNESGGTILHTDTATAGTDQKQSSRVNVGKDTVGKNTSPSNKSSN